MANDENQQPDGDTTDWADLRARAVKLDISFSEPQQRERQKKARLAKRAQSDAQRV